MWSVPGSGLSPNRPRAPQCKDTVWTITGPSAVMVFTSASSLGMGLFLQTKLRSHCLVEAGEKPWPSQHPSLLPQPGGSSMAGKWYWIHSRHLGSFQQLWYQGNLCPVWGVDQIPPSLAPPLLSSPMTSRLSLGRTGPVLTPAKERTALA